MTYAENDVLDFFTKLNERNINYLLIKNIGEELPKKLKYGKDIDILVHPDCYAKYLALMPTWGFKEIVHPHGTKRGWQFLYGMESCHKFEHRQSGIQIDGYAQLATKSIGMNAWLPLDKSIQESVWRNKVWNKQFKWWQMDDKNLLVYLVTRSVFEKEKFSSVYIADIEKLLPLIDEKTVQDKFGKIFFKFAPHLTEMLKEHSLEEIRDTYISFADY